jgi:hypothetical protein
MDRTELIAKLRTGVYNVTFTKVNGEERTMSCTLMESMLPPARAEDPITQKKVREINDKVVAAWCLDKQQFRSFRVENVIKIEQCKND